MYMCVWIHSASWDYISVSYTYSIHKIMYMYCIHSAYMRFFDDSCLLQYQYVHSNQSPSELVGPLDMISLTSLSCCAFLTL